MEMQLQTKDTLAALHLDPRTKLYLLIVGNVALFLAPSLLYQPSNREGLCYIAACGKPKEQLSLRFPQIRQSAGSLFGSTEIYILYRIFFVPLLTNPFQCCILFPSIYKFWMKGVLYEYTQH